MDKLNTAPQKTETELLQERVAHLENALSQLYALLTVPATLELRAWEKAIVAAIGKDPVEGIRAYLCAPPYLRFPPELVWTVGGVEADASPFEHLVFRKHPWKRQLFLRGRRLTASQLVGAMEANGMTPQETAEDYRLPVDAVHEAKDYCQRFAPLLALEAAMERLPAEGHREPLPR